MIREVKFSLEVQVELVMVQTGSSKPRITHGDFTGLCLVPLLLKTQTVASDN